MTIETDQVFVIRWRRPRVRARCQQCAELDKMVTARQAAALIRVDSRLIYHWVATEQLHFAETADGLLLICLNSLLDHMTKEKAKDESARGKGDYVDASG